MAVVALKVARVMKLSDRPDPWARTQESACVAWDCKLSL